MTQNSSTNVIDIRLNVVPNLKPLEATERRVAENVRKSNRRMKEEAKRAKQEREASFEEKIDSVKKRARDARPLIDVFFALFAEHDRRVQRQRKRTLAKETGGVEIAKEREVDSIAGRANLDPADTEQLLLGFTKAAKGLNLSQSELGDLIVVLANAFRAEGQSIGEIRAAMQHTEESLRDSQLDPGELRKLIETSSLLRRGLVEDLNLRGVDELIEKIDAGEVNLRTLLGTLQKIGPQVADLTRRNGKTLDESLDSMSTSAFSIIFESEMGKIISDFFAGALGSLKEAADELIKPDPVVIEQKSNVTRKKNREDLRPTSSIPFDPLDPKLLEHSPHLNEKFARQLQKELEGFILQLAQKAFTAEAAQKLAGSVDAGLLEAHKAEARPGEGAIDRRSIERQSEAILANSAAVNRNVLERLQWISSAEQQNAVRRALLAGVGEESLGIQHLSEQYGELSDSAHQAANSQAELQQTFSQFDAIAKDALGGFITDLRNGKSAAEALEAALRRIEDRLIDIVLDGLFSSSGGGLFGGILGGGLFGFRDGGPVKGFAAGGFVSGRGSATSDSIPALLSNGEFVATADATRNNRPLLEAMNAGQFNLKRLRRFADGGVVSANAFNQRLASSEIRLSPAATSAASARPMVVEPKVHLRNINAFDADDVVSQALAGPSGEKAVLNMVRTRPSAFRGALGL